ncbi:cation transporter [Gordonia rhizosphera]|uniref:cation transporter n=1 Tax=Gordonia rhizosphera TaxID=83341 RepID=UPI0002F6A33B|nr:cation transporter [Gordonia rhizosphera]
MSVEGSKRAIIAALLANAGIALAKFIGFLITTSSSMLAEAVHSVADTSNQERALLAAMSSDGVDRVIHMKTQYLGPEEMLVAAKIAIPPSADATTIAQTIDAAEVRVRTAVPQARIIYLEPDIDRGTR